MTTIDDAFHTITRTVRQNEPGELAREIRLLRAEIARLSSEIIELKSRPQVVELRSSPQPIYPNPLPCQHSSDFQVKWSDIGSVEQVVKAIDDCFRIGSKP